MEEIKDIKTSKITNPVVKSSKPKWQEWVAGLLQKSGLLLVCSVALLAVAVLSCVGLRFYGIDLDKKIESSAIQLADVEAKRDPELEKNFSELRKRIEGFELFLSNRVYASLVFVLLEELTLPQVQLINLQANLSEAKMQIGVEALDYTVLGQQIFVLEKDSRIQSVNPGIANLTVSGRVSCNLDIELDTDFLVSKK